MSMSTTYGRRCDVIVVASVGVSSGSATFPQESQTAETGRAPAHSQKAISARPRSIPDCALAFARLYAASISVTATIAPAAPATARFAALGGVAAEGVGGRPGGGGVGGATGAGVAPGGLKRMRPPSQL